jgi:hypothetical protein
MNFDLVNNALNVLDEELNEEMSTLKNKSEQELDESMKQFSGIMSKLNEIADGEFSQTESSVQLLELLTNISNNKNYGLLPDEKEINACIDYLKQKNDIQMLASTYYNLASIYDDMGKQSNAPQCDELASLYYALAIQELSKFVESDLEVYCEVYGILLSETSVFLDRTKKDVNFDISYIKSGWQYAIKCEKYELADNISNNYTVLYAGLGEEEKCQEIALLLIETHKLMVDHGCDFDLKKFINDAEAYAYGFRKLPGNNNDEKIAKGYLYAAYFAEHSNKESESYRNRKIALDYYWYCVYAQERAYSEYANKAYTAALKVPFSKDCRLIVKETKKARKG